MHRFHLIRDNKIVAVGVEFHDGVCVMRWLGKSASLTVYNDAMKLLRIHVKGHHTTVLEWKDAKQRLAWIRGGSDCCQDRCENIPFASIGGLGARQNSVVPKYISVKDREEYLAGYRNQARILFGDDWDTCEFSWCPTLTINDECPTAQPVTLADGE